MIGSLHTCILDARDAAKQDNETIQMLRNKTNQLEQEIRALVLDD